MESKNKNIIILASAVALLFLVSFFGYKKRDKLKTACDDLCKKISGLFKKEKT